MARNIFFGVNFYEESRHHLLCEIKNLASGPHKYIVTPNINHLANLSGEDINNAYAQAELRVCDSRFLIPFFRFMGNKKITAIPGSDLTRNVFELSVEMGWDISVVGAIAEDISTLRIKFPGITINHYSPPMGFIDQPEEVDKCIDFVVRNPAQFVIYALGFPRQEILAYKIHNTPGARGVGICSGASILFLSGRLRRAPVLVQKLGLEWLFRIVIEPKRLARRYFMDAIRFFPKVVFEVCQKRGEGGK